MALTDMKRPKPKPEKDDKASCIGDSEPYAYGLRVNLNRPELEKLGLKVSDFTVGEKMNLTATVEVIATREAAGRIADEYSINVELQITAMELGEAKKGSFSKYSDQQKKGPGE